MVTNADLATTRAILHLLSEGQTPSVILAAHPALTMLDVQAACAAGLAALDAPRTESRDERIARVRQTHPHAFEPWSGQDDACQVTPALLARRLDDAPWTPKGTS